MVNEWSNTKLKLHMICQNDHTHKQVQRQAAKETAPAVLLVFFFFLGRKEQKQNLSFYSALRSLLTGLLVY